jgi:hypothetical protein
LEGIAFLPSGVNSTPLSGTFDAFLDPALLFRVGDVHEFDAERRAIGTLEDIDHLAHGGVFETEHVIDENLAVVGRFR